MADYTFTVEFLSEDKSKNKGIAAEITKKIENIMGGDYIWKSKIITIKKKDQDVTITTHAVSKKNVYNILLLIASTEGVDIVDKKSIDFLTKDQLRKLEQTDEAGDLGEGAVSKTLGDIFVLKIKYTSAVAFSHASNLISTTRGATLILGDHSNKRIFFRSPKKTIARDIKHRCSSFNLKPDSFKITSPEEDEMTFLKEENAL